MGRTIRIGRNLNNDITLDSGYVSGSHAEIECSDAGTFILTDYSKNGTIVNGCIVNNRSVNINYGDNVLFAGIVALDWNMVRRCSSNAANIYGGFATVGYNQNSGQQIYNNPKSYSNSKIGFSDAIRICMKEKYASFEGRATRPEYWYFVLFYAIIMFAAAIVGGILGALFSGGDGEVAIGLALVLYGLVTLGFVCPGISVLVRRLHDTGRSGWFYWLCLIPWVGGIIILIFCCLDSQKVNNKYGPYIKSI